MEILAPSCSVYSRVMNQSLTMDRVSTTGRQDGKTFRNTFESIACKINLGHCRKYTCIAAWIVPISSGLTYVHTSFPSVFAISGTLPAAKYFFNIRSSAAHDCIYLLILAWRSWLFINTKHTSQLIYKCTLKILYLLRIQNSRVQKILCKRKRSIKELQLSFCSTFLLFLRGPPFLHRQTIGLHIFSVLRPNAFLFFLPCSSGRPLLRSRRRGELGDCGKNFAGTDRFGCHSVEI